MHTRLERSEQSRFRVVDGHSVDEAVDRVEDEAVHAVSGGVGEASADSVDALLAGCGVGRKWIAGGYACLLVEANGILRDAATSEVGGTKWEGRYLTACRGLFEIC